MTDLWVICAALQYCLFAQDLYNNFFANVTENLGQSGKEWFFISGSCEFRTCCFIPYKVFTANSVLLKCSKIYLKYFAYILL